MARDPLITCRVTITARDINNNNVAKVFTNVRAINIDYVDATINILDITGSFYFALTPVTTFTYNITGNVSNLTIS